MILGTTPEGADLGVDLDSLIGSHLCVAANSGGGKSGAIRKLLELTHGSVQQIVLDAEDEFYTLRERFDYVIAGGEGDAPATVANARGLAHASLSHGFSLIAQINDLGDDAGTFIAEFLAGLLAAPRDLWRPVLVVIDEAQRFAPTGAPSDSTAAMKDLLQRGRKRGFTAVLATTRMSELNAGVRGLCNNWLLGLVGQSLDRRTAADQLGFGQNSAEARGLQSLERRQFWAFGPALSRQPRLVTVGDVSTTILKHGQARVPTPPAPDALREILAGLAVPEPQPEPNYEATVGGPASEIRAAATSHRVADLETEVNSLREICDRKDRRIGVQAARLAAAEAALKRASEEARSLSNFVEATIDRLFDGDDYQGEATPAPTNPGGDHVDRSAVRALDLAGKDTGPRLSVVEAGIGSGSPADRRGPSTTKLTASAQKMVDALAKHHPRALPIEHVAKIAGVSIKSSMWTANRRSFEECPLVARNSGLWRMNPLGVAKYQLEDQPDDPQALLDFWANAFPPSTGNMLRVLVEAEGRWMPRADVATKAGVSPTSSGLSAGLKDLRSHGLVEDVNGLYRAAQVLL